MLILLTRQVSEHQWVQLISACHGTRVTPVYAISPAYAVSACIHCTISPSHEAMKHPSWSNCINVSWHTHTQTINSVRILSYHKGISDKGHSTVCLHLWWAWSTGRLRGEWREDTGGGKNSHGLSFYMMALQLTNVLSILKIKNSIPLIYIWNQWMCSSPWLQVASWAHIPPLISNVSITCKKAGTNNHNNNESWRP